MAFSRRGRQRRERAKRSPLGIFLGHCVHSVLRLAFGATVIGVVGAGLLYLRLSQGPIHLPYIAQVAVHLFNQDSDQFEVELGDLILTVGDAGSPAGIQFINLQVRSVEGETLFAIPRLSAKFDRSALLHGDLRPTRMVVIRPEARLLRTREGKFLFGLGALPTAGDGLAGEAPQIEAISRILDGLVGDAELTPVLSRLTEIVITNADLTYENETIGRSWRTRRADLRVYRADSGLRAVPQRAQAVEDARVDS